MERENDDDDDDEKRLYSVKKDKYICIYLNVTVDEHHDDGVKSIERIIENGLDNG